MLIMIKPSLQAELKKLIHCFNHLLLRVVEQPQGMKQEMMKLLT
jgi:hypothetical protein